MEGSSNTECSGSGWQDTLPDSSEGLSYVGNMADAANLIPSLAELSTRVRLRLPYAVVKY